MNILLSTLLFFRGHTSLSGHVQACAKWVLDFSLRTAASLHRQDNEIALYLGRSRLEEPVKAEAPGLPDLSLELIPGAIAKPVDHTQDEAVLLLCMSTQALVIKACSCPHKGGRLLHREGDRILMALCTCSYGDGYPLGLLQAAQGLEGRMTGILHEDFEKLICWMAEACFSDDFIAPCGRHYGRPP